MSHFDRQMCRKADELPLAKLLARDLVTCPLFGRGDGLSWKSKTNDRRKLKDGVNDEVPKQEAPKRALRKRHRKNLVQVINLTDAIRNKLIGISKDKYAEVSERQTRETGQTNKLKFASMEMAYFARLSKYDSKNDETVTSSVSTSKMPFKMEQWSAEEVSELKSLSSYHGSTNKKESKLLTKPLMSEVSETSSKQLRKVSSEVRLDGQDLMLLNETEGKQSSISSVTSTQNNDSNVLLGQEPDYKEPKRIILRQPSEINLTNFMDHMGMDSIGSVADSTLDEVDSIKSSCTSPGNGFVQHCHSVAATVLGKSTQEPYLSSSTSSDDLFESTRYAREVLEEKLGGVIDLTHREEVIKTKEIPKREKKKETVRAKRKCQCHKKKISHRTCLLKDADETQTDNKDNESLMTTASDQEYDGESQQPQSVDGDLHDDLPNASQIRDTKEKTEELTDQLKAGSRENLSQPSNTQGTSGPVEISLQQSCQRSPKLMTLPHSNHSSRASSRKSRKNREICSIKTCKAIRNYSKRWSARRHYPKENLHRLKSKTHVEKRISRKRRRPKIKEFTCNCHKIYIDESEGTDDLWCDTNLKRSHNRRYSLTIEQTNKISMKKCGGYASETGGHCHCYICSVKGNPWSHFLRRPNTLVDVPYSTLTSSALNERAKRVNELKKTLRDKYEWSKEDLKNFCTRHRVCKEPSVRKSLLHENPFIWKWCDTKNDKIPKQTKKDDIVKGKQAGKFGYFVEIIEERLTRNEHFSNVQKLVEKVVYCKWNQDIAEMKLQHFQNNMPKQQTCYPEMRSFDPVRRTCYNPKLIERLADMVKFSDSPDRKIHEFSFPSKLLKYQEPQLVGDVGTDMIEIRPLLETMQFPTIYRDLFKNKRHTQRKLMDAILPPLQWTDNAGLWQMKVSLEPDCENTNRDIINQLDYNETLCHAINRRFCAGRYRLYFEVFAEVIRQELMDNPERAFLLSRIREEYLLTMLLYDGGLEMTLVSTTHLWKEMEDHVTDQTEMEALEKTIGDLESQIKLAKSAIYDLEKRSEEKATVNEYLHEDQGKLYKKTNHQLAAQYEAIKAGLLYDLD